MSRPIGKVIGIEYGITSVVVLVLTGLFALITVPSWPHRVCSS
ncbi:MAG: hypothetical protein U0Z44_14060 [Kouleothrix sp.]